MRLLRCVVFAVSRATWLLLNGVLAWCGVFHVPCSGPLCSWSSVCLPGAWCSVRGVLGHLTPVHRCARSLRCGACAVSWAAWLLFTSVRARCVVLRVRCTGPLGSCSPVCLLGAWCCVRGVLGHLAPVHRCARSLRSVAFAVFWATWLLLTGVHAPCVSFLLSFLLSALSWLVPLLVPLASAPPGCSPFSSSVCGLACGVCAVCWCCAPPAGSCSSCFALSRVLLCGAVVWCGPFFVVRGVLRCFSVTCCAGVRVSCCVVCCRALLLVLSLCPGVPRFVRCSVVCGQSTPPPRGGLHLTWILDASIFIMCSGPM